MELGQGNPFSARMWGWLTPRARGPGWGRRRAVTWSLSPLVKTFDCKSPDPVLMHCLPAPLQASGAPPRGRELWELTVFVQLFAGLGHWLGTLALRPPSWQDGPAGELFCGASDQSQVSFYLLLKIKVYFCASQGSGYSDKLSWTLGVFKKFVKSI